MILNVNGSVLNRLQQKLKHYLPKHSAGENSVEARTQASSSTSQTDTATSLNSLTSQDTIHLVDKPKAKSARAQKPIRTLKAAKLSPNTAKAVKALQGEAGDLFFRTKYDSIYRVDNTRTTRFKSDKIAKRHAERPGLRQKSDLTLYAKPAVIQQVYKTCYDYPNQFRLSNTITNGLPYLVISECNQQGEVVYKTYYPAKLKPAVKLTPVEFQDIDAENFNLHIGHRIKQIFHLAPVEAAHSKPIATKGKAVHD